MPGPSEKEKVVCRESYPLPQSGQTLDISTLENASLYNHTTRTEKSVPAAVVRQKKSPA